MASIRHIRTSRYPVGSGRAGARRVMPLLLVLVITLVSAGLGMAGDGHAPDMTLTPDVLEALDAMSKGQASEAQAALLFKNNDKINRARLNDWISDQQYQAAQTDYSDRNQAFAKSAADTVIGEGNFTPQAPKPGKPKVFSPGTDSDYIIKNVSDPQQVSQMQQAYNQSIDEFLQKNNVLDQPGTKWNNKLDVDFMADPSKLTAAQFEEIAKLNNDAYKRQLAADYERLSRLPAGQSTEPISPGHVLAYTQEMKDFIEKKQRLLDDLRNNPDAWSDPANKADIYRKMAQEQKYIERIESLTDTLRREKGLDAIQRNPIDGPDSPYKSPYTLTTYDDGTAILTKRTVVDADGTTIIDTRETGSIAQRGSIRTPQNMAQTMLGDAVSGNSVNRAVTQLAETYAQLAKTDPDFRKAARDIAAITDTLSASEKGLLLENIRRIAADQPGVPLAQAQASADALASDIAKAMRDRSPPRITDPATKSDFAQAVDQAREQAAGVDVTPNSLLEYTRQIDQSLATSLGLSNDLSNMSVTRQQMNELAGRLPDINGLLNFVFLVQEAREAGSTLGTYLGHLSLARDPSVPDAVADQHFAAMDALARQMIAQGMFGAAFGTVMEAFPTVGAVVGTYMASHGATRWVLENTQTGQAIDRAAGRAMDNLFETKDSVVDTFESWTGGETKASRDHKLRQRYIDVYKSALGRGTLKLRGDATIDQVIDALNNGTDVGVINRTLVQPASPSRGGKASPAAPVKGGKASPAASVNCRHYCMYDYVQSYAPGAYMFCTAISPNISGTPQYCGQVSGQAKGGSLPAALKTPPAVPATPSSSATQSGRPPAAASISPVPSPNAPKLPAGTGHQPSTTTPPTTPTRTPQLPPRAAMGATPKTAAPAASTPTPALLPPRTATPSPATTPTRTPQLPPRSTMGPTPKTAAPAAGTPSPSLPPRTATPSPATTPTTTPQLPPRSTSIGPTPNTGKPAAGTPSPASPAPRTATTGAGPTVRGASSMPVHPAGAPPVPKAGPSNVIIHPTGSSPSVHKAPGPAIPRATATAARTPSYPSKPAQPSRSGTGGRTPPPAIVRAPPPRIVSRPPPAAAAVNRPPQIASRPSPPPRVNTQQHNCQIVNGTRVCK